MSQSLDSLIALLTQKLSSITDTSTNGEDLLLISKAISQINEVQNSEARYQSLVDRLTALEGTVGTNNDTINALVTENDSKINSLTLALNEHKANINNPNNVTKNQVGLNLVDNFTNTFDINDSSTDKYALAKGVNELHNKIQALENNILSNTNKIQALENKPYIIFSKYRDTTIREYPAWRRCRIWSDGYCEHEGYEIVYIIPEETSFNDKYGAAFITLDVDYIDNRVAYTTIHTNGTSSHRLYGGIDLTNTPKLRVMSYMLDNSHIPTNAPFDITWTTRGYINPSSQTIAHLNNLYS